MRVGGGDAVAVAAGRVGRASRVLAGLAGRFLLGGFRARGGGSGRGLGDVLEKRLGLIARRLLGESALLELGAAVAQRLADDPKALERRYGVAP